MLRTIVLLLFIFLFQYCKSQHGDCVNALPLKADSLYSFDNISGFGKALEIDNNDLGDIHYFTSEHNTSWHYFIPEENGKLIFEVIPHHPTDDWDFLLFKDKDGKLCEQIATKKQFPIRSNLARNNLKTGGKTGLSLKAKSEFEAAGLNPNFSKFLDVEKGAKYLLVLDNNTIQGHGYSIKLNLIVPNAVEDSTVNQVQSPFRKELEWINKKPEIPKTEYNFEIIEAKSKQPLACSVKVVIEKGFGNDSTLEFKDKSSVSFFIEQSTNFSINVSKTGYMFLSQNYRSPRKDSTLNYKFELPQAKAGALISLPDINFRENTTHLLTNSINGLQQIFDFMKSNPDAVIEIRGHVNAPGFENSGKVKRFSKKRAEEVKAFLEDMGIDGNRMKTEGLGNGFMIYPAPVNYDQEKANRRVEIKILKN